MTFSLGKRQAGVPSWILPAVAYAVSVISLIWVLQGVDFHSVAAEFRHLRWGWVAVAIASDLGVYVFQAWRWNLLLSPVVKPPLWRSVQAIFVGLFANEVLPLRPGEVIRAYLQGHWSEIPFSVALSSAIIERIFDGLWIMGAFGLVMTFEPLPRYVIDMGKVLGIFVAAFTMCLVFVLFWKSHAHAACPKTLWGAKLRILIDDLHLMGRSKLFYAAGAASLPYLLVQVVPIYALMRAYDLDLSLWPALVVLVIYRMGTVLPQAPANVGASQMVLVLALRLFHVDKTTAMGFSIIAWGVITLPLLAAGFIALSLAEMDIGEISRHAHRNAHAPGPEELRPV
jgi:hypothetical protein